MCCWKQRTGDASSSGGLQRGHTSRGVSGKRPRPLGSVLRGNKNNYDNNWMVNGGAARNSCFELRRQSSANTLLIRLQRVAAANGKRAIELARCWWNLASRVVTSLPLIFNAPTFLPFFRKCGNRSSARRIPLPSPSPLLLILLTEERGEAKYTRFGGYFYDISRIV